MSNDNIREKSEVCHWCGEVIDTEPVLWDIREKRTTDVYWRYRFCSENCLDAARHADHRYAQTYTDGERLREEKINEVHR